MFEAKFLCPERRGTVIRTVREVEASPLLEIYLAAKLPDPPASPMKDLNHIYSIGARTFLVDDVGMLFKGIIMFDGMPDVHICFWDRILRGREDLCQMMAAMVIDQENVPGVWTAIPKESATTIAFAKRAGFKELKQSENIVVLSLVT